MRFFTNNPVLLLNIAFLAALATSGLAAFVLARHMTGSNLGAALAGVIFAFAPYRWAHIPHLQLQLAFAIPLSFYFARRLRKGATVTGSVGLGLSVAAAFGSSGYYAIYLLTALPLVARGGARSYRSLSSAPDFARIRSGRIDRRRRFGCPSPCPTPVSFRPAPTRAFETAEQYSAGWTEYVSSFSKLHFFLPKAEEPLFPGFVASPARLGRSRRFFS